MHSILHKNHSRSSLLRVLVSTMLVLCILTFSNLVQADVVKMSNSKICHDRSSPYYSRTKNFKAFETLQACLLAGGRLPKVQGNPRPESNRVQQSHTNSYSRDAFSHWVDDDRDCLNTRHELLLELSTGPVTLSEDGCRVIRGRWNDPYSGQIFFDSQLMDIDHLVPLAWAWENGANTWTPSQRRQFANDPVNLFAVDASLNRSKGSKGPENWLPPNQKFHCQYLTRYLRVTLKYDFDESSRARIRKLQTKVCT